MVPEKLNLGSKENIKLLSDFIESQGLVFEGVPEYTVILKDESGITATASYDDGVVKYFAVREDHRGLGFSGMLLTELRKYAFDHGRENLFLVTSPKNKKFFDGLLFSEITSTENTVFMESPSGGMEKYFANVKDSHAAGIIGSIVMNCDPFTKGHRYLIETAAKECDFVYVFVLSEKKSFFPAEKRYAAVKAGTAGLSNVKVVKTEKYLISSATFPTYFIKDRLKTEDIFCELDIKMFTEKFIPKLGITRRYLGTEPFCPVTGRYNEALLKELPGAGCEVRIIPRLEQDGEAVSAEKVRKLISEGKAEEAKALLPETTVKIIF